MKWNCQELLIPKQAGQVCPQQPAVTGAAGWTPRAESCEDGCWALPSSLQVLFRHWLSILHCNKEGSESTPTFVFFFSCSNFLYLFGWFHEEREDGSQPKDVHKLVTVVCALWSNHGVVQHLQGAAAGNLLLSVKRGKLNCTGTWGALEHPALKRQGKEHDKDKMKSLSTSSKQDFSSRSQNTASTVTLFKTVAENIVLVISFLMSFISFYFLFLFHFMYFIVVVLFSYFLATEEDIFSLLYKHWHQTEGEGGWVGYKRQILSPKKSGFQSKNSLI